MFCLTSLFSSAVHSFLGNRLSLLLGGVIYVLNLLANIPGDWVFLLSCIFVGAAATIIWTAQGVLISKQASVAGQGSFGTLSGLFFAVYQANGIVGNFIAQGFANSGISFALSVVVLSSVCACGVALFLFLVHTEAEQDESDSFRPSSDDELEQLVRAHDSDGADSLPPPLLIDVADDSDNEDGNDEQRNGGQSQSNDDDKSVTSLGLLLRSDFGHLLPLIAYSGTSKAFIFGSIPPLFGEDLIGYGMACFSLMNVVGSLFFGRLSDVAGRRVVLALAGMLTAGGIVSANLGNSTSRLYVLFIAATCMGLSDAAFTNQLFGLISQYSQRGQLNPARGFGYLQFCRTFFTAIAFVYSLYLTILEISTLLMGLLILGLLFLSFYHCFLNSIEMTPISNS